MSSVPSLRQLLSAWRFLVIVTFLGACLAIGLSFITPLQYSSSVRVLITQNNAGSTDPYTALKFTERIASSLSELLYSSAFANNIITKNQEFDATYLPVNEYEKRKAWRKMIETGVEPGTGIMTITAYHPNRDQARILVGAASQEITVQAPNYFGYNVRVQVIDAPLDSRWYTRPNFLKNAVLGMAMGFLLALIWQLGFRQGKRVG